MSLLHFQAEEITLTIGQAFELAYKKFLDTSGKEMETKKQILVLQKRVAILENENGELKKRLKDVANIKGQADVQQYLHSCGVSSLINPLVGEQPQTWINHYRSETCARCPYRRICNLLLPRHRTATRA